MNERADERMDRNEAKNASHGGLKLHEIDATLSFNKHKLLSHELGSERVSGASERASGRANGPILYASISLSFYPQCIAVVAVAVFA